MDYDAQMNQDSKQIYQDGSPVMNFDTQMIHYDKELLQNKNQMNQEDRDLGSEDNNQKHMSERILPLDENDNHINFDVTQSKDDNEYQPSGNHLNAFVVDMNPVVELSEPSPFSTPPRKTEDDNDMAFDDRTPRRQKK